MRQEKLPEKLGPDDEIKKSSRALGVRHIQVACMCACVTTLIIARGSMGVAILAMTDASRLNDTSVMIFDWNKQTQGVILSSFFWGYLVMQIPSGILAKKFGGKPILFVSLLANGMLCLLLPTLAHVGGWMTVCAARVCMGLTQACLFSSCHTLLGRWLPAHERTALSGLVYGGTQLGTIISMPVSGVLAGTALGWKMIFYSMSALLFVVAVLWQAFTASSPAEHWLIGRDELQYIESFMTLNTAKHAASPPIPWKNIFRSVPMWAIVSAHMGCSIGFVLFFVDMPTYLEKGLHISLKSSASLSALPYVGMWVGSTVATILSEQLNNRGLLSLGACRKIANSLGLFGVAGGLVALSFLGPAHATLAIVTLVGALTLYGFSMAGFMVNHMDLSPNFGGVLLSLTNFMGSIGAVLTPLVTGLVLRDDPTDVSRWRVVFLLTAALSALANAVYLVYGSAARQPWDQPEHGDVIDPEEMTPVMMMNQEKEKEAKTIQF